VITVILTVLSRISFVIFRIYRFIGAFLSLIFASPTCRRQIFERTWRILAYRVVQTTVPV